MSNAEVDAEIVKRVQQGEKKAFDILVLKYQHKIANLVARYSSHPGDVMDITQEAFIKAYRALPNFRGDSAFYTWIYRIAINTAKNYVVAQSRRPPTSDIDAAEAEQYSGFDSLKGGDTPEKLLMRDELKAVVFKTIESLAEELKVAITLREFEGLSYEEIADIMECPVGTVRSRIFRAREIIDNNIRPLMS